MERLGDQLGQARTVLVGPGLDDVEATEALLRALVPALAPDTALVLDAYAPRC